MTYRIAFPLLALLTAGGCSGRDATGPTTSVVSPSATVSSSRNEGNDNDGGSSRRSGALHVTKDCTGYSAKAGQSCTITSSNLKQIAVGSRVVYEKGAVGATLDTDLILYGRGNNSAFGHVVLNLATGTGVVTFSGGTGKFKGFRATVDVSPLGWPFFAWDGTYSFSSKGDED